MPTYDYLCPSCGGEVEIWKDVKDWDRSEHCESCGTIMNKIIRHAPMGIVDLKLHDAQAKIDGEY